MKKYKIVSAISLYITFMFIGHHGPFSLHRSSDDQAHTHKKHVIKLHRVEEDQKSALKLRRLIPLSA